MVLYAQLRTRPSFSRRETGGGSFIDPGQRPVSWIYCSAVRIVGLRAPTADVLHVACAVLLACCWRWQYVGVAAALLHWLLVVSNYISPTSNTFDILTDGCKKTIPIRGGDISIFTAQSLEWSFTRKLPTCDYCCCFAATAADRWWWCFVLVLLYICCCSCCSCCSCCCSSALLICY